ncbi:hypothetical protein [Azospirillum sp. B510]|uniref:hypothetical protein n=1 Tax=Azospirillum sp. (strain B510) TaxID=137722 RepID=UPI0005A8013A|nr:hypothetical protein [Azospirillum sp. B510]
MYRGIERVYCPGAALRRGCPSIERALVALDRLVELGPLDDDEMVDTALGACDRGCPDTRCGEVDEAGTVCLQPLAYDSAAVERDLTQLGGRHAY